MAIRETDDTARGAGISGILEIVRRRRLLALLPFVFILTAAASFAFFLPSLWTSRALVLVNRPQISPEFVKQTVQADVEARLMTLSQEVLTSSRLQEIATRYDLYPAARRKGAMDDVVDKMRKDIRIELVESDRTRRNDSRSAVVFSVAYTAPHPGVAADVANTLADLYIQENSRVREEQAVGATQFLEGQLGELRRKLQEQERRITEYKEQHMGELPEQRDVNLRTLERLQQQIQVASETHRRANERRQLITQSLAELDLTSGAATGSTTAAGPTVTPADTAAARLNLLRQELAALETRYTPRYPDVVQMREQVRIAEEALEAEKKKQQQATAAAASVATGKAADKARASKELRVVPQNAYIQSLMTQLDQANVEAKTTAEELAGLQREMKTYQRRLENTPKREQELALITRDYETTRELFRSLLAKHGEAGVAAELEQKQKGETFRIVEAADMPDRPTGPNRMRLLLVGLVLALGAAGVAVVLAEQVDTSYRRVDEVRATTPLPVLSTIPRITTEADRTAALRQRRWATVAVAAGLLVIAGASFGVAHNNQTLVSLLSADLAATPRR